VGTRQTTPNWLQQGTRGPSGLQFRAGFRYIGLTRWYFLGFELFRRRLYARWHGVVDAAIIKIRAGPHRALPLKFPTARADHFVSRAERPGRNRASMMSAPRRRPPVRGTTRLNYFQNHTHWNFSPYHFRPLRECACVKSCTHQADQGIYVGIRS
jgi:hypothetical protein